MNWIFITAAALMAQAPSAEMEKAKAEITRLEQLVAAGAIAPARLADARQALADSPGRVIGRV